MSDWAFTYRVLTVFAIGALALAAWVLSDLLLLIFAAVLCAVTLRTLMGPLIRSGLNEWLALAAVVILIVLVGAGLILQFGSRLADQTEYLLDNVPTALRSLAQELDLDLDSISRGVDGSALGAIASRVLYIGSSIVAAFAALVLVIVGGIYFAAQPETYRKGLITLVPARWRNAFTATLDDSSFALSRWLRAQLIAMVLIGVMTGVGMWLVGVPSPLALGLIAGITEFVPIVGPIAGAIPALLLASTNGWDMTLAALMVAIVIQQIENNAIMPFVVGKVVEIPAAVGLFATVAMGLMFGPLGLLLGYPLAIVADVAVRRLYVRELLGKPVEIPAERERHAKPAPHAAE